VILLVQDGNQDIGRVELGNTPTLNLNNLMTHTICSVGFLLYICEMEPMETSEQLFRDVAFGLDMSGDIYEQALKEFHSQRLRHKMGGDKGIHLTIKNTEDGN